jgi:hypothetical protein
VKDGARCCCILARPQGELPDAHPAATFAIAGAALLAYVALMAVERILFRGGARDGLLTAVGEHPDTLFRIDDVETLEAYARVEDEVTDDGVGVAVFRLDPDGELRGEAKCRFAPELP